MKITTLLIDDEPKALTILADKIKRLCPELEIVGATQNATEALELIENLSPQLVFLDIAMPQISGFDLLSKIDTPEFEIIFATAFDQYAIDAIRHCAIGYLVKPIDNQDLLHAVKNAISNIRNKSAFKKNRTLIENNAVEIGQKKLVIPTPEGFEFVLITSIVRCEGIKGYTELHFENRKRIVSSYSIGYFHKLLKAANFYLVHKSHLVNVEHIIKYLNEGYVELSNRQKVPVSRSKRNDFLTFLK